MDSSTFALVKRDWFVEQLSATDTSHLIGLYGPPGSGKTYLLAAMVAHREQTAALTPPGKGALISLDPIPANDPLRQVESLRFSDLPATDALARLRAMLGLALPLDNSSPEVLPLFAHTWTLVEHADDERPTALLLIDEYSAISTEQERDWFCEQLIKPLVASHTPACRVVCAQRTPIAWALPELERLAKTVQMQSFAETEIKQYVSRVLPITSVLLPHLLWLCTSGFPLALVAWKDVIVPDEPLDASRNGNDPRLWHGRGNAPLTPEAVLIATGAALLRSFDRSALDALFAPEEPVGSMLAALLGQSYAALLLPRQPFVKSAYLLARRAMLDHGWLVNPASDPTAEVVTPAARDAIYDLLQIDGGLARAIDQLLAAHYRSRIDRDPFRAQTALVDWLYYTAGHAELCADEWAEANTLFSQTRQQLVSVLKQNPFADLRLLSDFYTNKEILLRLEQRGIFDKVEAQLGALADAVSATLAQLREQGVQLDDGQEIRDDSLDSAPPPLLRLSRRALGKALARVATSVQAWDIAFGPYFDASEDFSRVTLQKNDTSLYDLLRKNGLIIGRSTNSLTPMIRNMFRGERTLIGRLARKLAP